METDTPQRSTAQQQGRDALENIPEDKAVSKEVKQGFQMQGRPWPSAKP